MTAPEPGNANNLKSAAAPSKTEEGRSPQWSLKVGDASQNGDLDESAPPLSDRDLSNTGTHFGGAFQQAVELEAGTIIGGAYRIIKLIGRGGMGQVYLAEHLALTKKCALKIMPSNLVTEKAWKRFQTEAKAISGLEHTNLVRVTDLGIHENSLPYFAMEHVDGLSLAQLLAKNERLSQDQTVQILNQICEGIECAHRQGIVHRDLKPANIMICEDKDHTGQLKVKLLDFGLAKLSQKEAADVNLTATGEIFGSPLYMSPEQCAGDATDERSDIYSLGCTMYECLTGKPPFTGERAIPIMNNKIFKDAPSLSASPCGKSFPAELEFIVGKMLKKDVKERYQNIAQLKGDLQAAADGRLAWPGNTTSTSKRNLAERIGQLNRKNSDGSKSRYTRHEKIGIALFVSFLVLVPLDLGFQYLRPHYLAPPLSSASSLGPQNLVPDFVGAEGYLSRIRMCRDEEFHTTQGISSGRIAELDQIIKDAEAHLCLLGDKAVYPCIKDIQDETQSSGSARNVLTRLGPGAVDPIVDAIMLDPILSSKMAQVLARLGPAVGDKLCAIADGKDSKQSTYAIATLASIVKAPPLPWATGEIERVMTENNRNTLLKILARTDDENTRRLLIEILGYFHSPSPEAVTSLRQVLLTDRSESVQNEAAQTLGQMLAGASKYGSVSIVDALCEALAVPHQSDGIKLACLDALRLSKGTINFTGQSKIRQFTKDPAESVRIGALRTLAAAAQDDPASISDLIAALNERNTPAQDAAFQAVIRLGPRAKPVMPTLLRIAAEMPTMSQVISAIGAIGVAGDREALMGLIRVLEVPVDGFNWIQKRDAMTALGKLGAEAKPAVPALKKLLNCQNYGLSFYARKALKEISGSDQS
jgi:serine/threonine protein kinase/HEAT repeat protein